MSKRKQPRTMHGKDGQRDAPRAGSRSDNPIIAAVERGLRGRRPTVVLDGWESVPEAQLRAAVRFNFDDETIREVGTLVLLSLLTGDRRMVETVKHAIKQADHLFNRDREPVLLKQALAYMLGEGRGLDLDSLKEGIEQHFYAGNKLPQSRWNRIRKAMRLPRRDAGRHPE